MTTDIRDSLSNTEQDPTLQIQDPTLQIHGLVESNPKFAASYIRAIDLIDFAMQAWRDREANTPAKANAEIIKIVPKAIAIAFKGTPENEASIPSLRPYSDIQDAMAARVISRLTAGAVCLSDDNLHGIGLPTRADIRYGRWRDAIDALHGANGIPKGDVSDLLVAFDQAEEDHTRPIYANTTRAINGSLHTKGMNGTRRPYVNGDARPETYAQRVSQQSEGSERSL